MRDPNFLQQSLNSKPDISLLEFSMNESKLNRFTASIVHVSSIEPETKNNYTLNLGPKSLPQKKTERPKKYPKHP